MEALSDRLLCYLWKMLSHFVYSGCKSDKAKTHYKVCTEVKHGGVATRSDLAEEPVSHTLIHLLVL